VNKAVQMGGPFQTYTIAPGYIYLNHPDHRNGTADKSQWSISEVDERSVFNRSRINNWLPPSPGWGLHSHNDHTMYLGTSSDGVRSLLVAKFVASSAPIVWHGYPADHQRKRQDVPTREILVAWTNLRLINEPQMRKILRGQPCEL
jgi:hypothetical protein